MAISVSSTLAAAITSPARQPVLQVTLTLGGTDYTFQSTTDQDMITGYNLQRTPQEQVIRASQISGTIAAQCNFTLQGWQATVDGGFLSSSDLSIYKAGFSALRDNDYGIDAPVVVRQGFVTTAGVETVQVFTGYVDRFNVNSDGSVSFSCLDFAGRLQGATAVPAAVGVSVVSGSSATSGPAAYLAPLPVGPVIEYLLRKGGFYLYPPALGNCVLATHSYVPDIGRLDALTGSMNYRSDTTKWKGSAYGQKGSVFQMTQPYTPFVGQTIIVEARFGVTSSIDREFLRIGDLVISRQATTNFMVLTVGATSIVTNAVLPTPPWPSDPGWNYYYFEISHTATGTSWFVQRDTATWSGTSSTSLAVQDGSTVAIPGIPYEGLSIRFETTGQFTRVVRDTWLPNFTLTWRVSTTYRAGSIPVIPETKGSAWALLGEIAAAFGARFRWTEAGAFEWMSRDILQGLRTVGGGRQYDGSRALMASGFSYEGASRIGSVKATWRDPSINTSTPTEPAWAATDVITAPASARTVLTFQTTNPIVRIDPPVAGYSFPGTSRSRYTAVPAYQVGDPAAADVTANVKITATPTPGGFTATIVNRWNQDIALWDPVTLAPAFYIIGTEVVGSDVVVNHTFDGSAKSTETFEVPDSPWRLDRAAALQEAELIAADGALPALVLSSQQVVSDLRTTVTDVVLIQDPNLMDAPVPCIVIGKDSDLTEDTLTVVPCYPPTGWVLGVTGRSELAATPTTILVA